MGVVSKQYYHHLAQLRVLLLTDNDSRGKSLMVNQSKNIRNAMKEWEIWSSEHNGAFSSIPNNLEKISGASGIFRKKFNLNSEKWNTVLI